ncbi:alkaline phosphatase [Tuberibacillus sp. Marseille-P3662]|uniref:alkaline phosphatase n=1 Tax=Tuberibacillus sp. Marseille-P3662 TaxID=1965358 RepID=UPI00111C7959|nr:alkaline phosphatase [Tuberibacillus sp. Marseille-P3662]
MGKTRKILGSLGLASALAVGGFAGVQIHTDSADARTPQEKPPHTQPKQLGKIKNVIFLIGDGMGPSYTTAYRMYKDDPKTKQMETTAFDRYLVGTQATHPDDPNENITDSAAAATSMAAGIKTYNGAISVDNDKSRVKTILERAKEKSKATGLVATSQINHATPAAFGTHNEDRNNYNTIADDYFDDMIRGQHKVDVLLGGGTNYFKRDDRNLVQDFKQAGFGYVTNTKQLKSDQHEQLLGLFAPVGLPKMIDRTNKTPSLETMTHEALERLQKDKDGFFLMVEGSQIDWAGHSNDIVGAMSEMEDFEKAFQAAINFAKQDKHTLVVTTADHSTGGLSIGRGGPYVWNPKPIKAADRTPEFMAAAIKDGASVEKTLDQYIDFELKQKELESVKKAAQSEDQSAIQTAIAEIFNVRSHTGWTTGGHTGVDVPVYAYGPGKMMFSGFYENTNMAKSIRKVLK